MFQIGDLVIRQPQHQGGGWGDDIGPLKSSIFRVQDVLACGFYLELEGVDAAWASKYFNPVPQVDDLTEFM